MPRLNRPDDDSRETVCVSCGGSGRSWDVTRRPPREVRCPACKGVGMLRNIPPRRRPQTVLTVKDATQMQENNFQQFAEMGSRMRSVTRANLTAEIATTVDELRVVLKNVPGTVSFEANIGLSDFDSVVTRLYDADDPETIDSVVAKARTVVARLDRVSDNNMVPVGTQTRVKEILSLLLELLVDVVASNVRR